MAIDSPLTCYICGKTEDRATVDMIGCLKDQDAAEKRMRQKFTEEKTWGYIDICPECWKNNKAYAQNVIEKYGIYK